MAKVDRPVVGIVMGSESDWPVLSRAAEALEELGVAYEARVVSAHRTPGRMASYGRSAERRGLQVVIAGAGGAAHLPGMLASHTSLPVIGVPVGNGSLGGLDALLSIAQMPAGVPVATMAIGGARNAGLLAARILALGDRRLARRLKAGRVRLADTAQAMNRRVVADARRRSQRGESAAPQLERKAPGRRVGR